MSFEKKRINFFFLNDQGQYEGEVLTFDGQKFTFPTYVNDVLEGDYYEIEEDSGALRLAAYAFEKGEQTGEGAYVEFGQDNPFTLVPESGLAADDAWRVTEKTGVQADITKKENGSCYINVADYVCLITKDGQITVSKRVDDTTVFATVNPKNTLLTLNYHVGDYEHFTAKYNVSSNTFTGEKVKDKVTHTVTAEDKNGVRLQKTGVGEDKKGYTFNEGQLYIGELDKKGVPSGEGVYFDTDYRMYLGQWKGKKLKKIYLNELKQAQVASGVAEVSAGYAYGQ